MMSNIVSGSVFQFDLVDLAVIGKNEEGIILNYKQGLKVQITISDEDDIERQYVEICAAQINYNKEKSQLFTQ